MISWRTGTVTELLAERAGMQEVNVKLEDGHVEKALHDTTVHQPLLEGDQVLLNTTAVRLKLGTGGYHFVHAVLSGSKAVLTRNEAIPNRSETLPWRKETGINSSEELQEWSEYEESSCESLPVKPVKRLAQGHLMKLKYTSLQRAVLAAEEDKSPYHSVFQEHQSIADTPVLIGELHSMLPIAVSWLIYRKPNLRIAYIMSDGGALPLSFSRHVAALKQLSWLCGTITYGQAYGGDLETINKFTACIAAKHIMKADLIVVCMGPGIAGTGTLLGHTGTETGEIANAVHMLGGKPIMIPRVSEADRRSRHFGISHHVLGSLLYAAACPAVLPLSSRVSEQMALHMKHQLQPAMEQGRHHILWMEQPPIEDVRTALEAYPLSITTMGRTVHDDPCFYVNVAASAEYALQCLDHSTNPVE